MHEYKLNTWSINGLDYITPQPNVMPTAESEYIILSPTSNKTCYLYKDSGLGTPAVGNSLEATVKFPIYSVMCNGTQSIETNINLEDETVIKITAYIDIESSIKHILCQAGTDSNKFIIAVAGSGENNIQVTYGENALFTTFEFESSAFYTFKFAKGKLYIDDAVVSTHNVLPEDPIGSITLFNTIDDIPGWNEEVQFVEISDAESLLLSLTPTIDEDIPGFLTNENEFIGSSTLPFTSFTGPSDYNIDAYFTMCLDDGNRRVNAKIYRDKVLLNDIEIATGFYLDTEATYTITLQNGECVFYINHLLIDRYNILQRSQGVIKSVGFTDAQSGSNPIYIRILKDSQKCIHYFLPNAIDFELEIDIDPTFSSDYKRTYTKQDFIDAPEEPEAWDPVELVCGSKESGTYDFMGLVFAATVQMPERQPGQSYQFYYRIRFNSDYFYSAYSYFYMTHRERTYFLDDNIVVLPETPLADKATYTIDNTGNTDLIVYRYPIEDGIRLPDIPAYSSVCFIYDKNANTWLFQILHKQEQFLLPYNTAPVVFDSVFNKVIPYDGEVYTTDMNSGESANIINAKAYEIDTATQYITEQRRNLSTAGSDINTGNTRWERVFNFDASVFKNPAEEKHTFQCITEQLKGQTIKGAIYDLIYSITGCAPKITEYKDKIFNVVYSRAESGALPQTDKYYLYDDENYSLLAKPFVIYNQQDRMLTWQIDIFDTQNIGYNQDVISSIIDMFKPAHTYVFINFYDKDGIIIGTRYYYGYANYLNAGYNL